MVPLTTLELLRFDPVRFSHDLAEKIKQAPNFFKNLPLVLSLEKLESERTAVDFALLRQLCIDQGIQLVGIKTDRPEDKQLADAAGMAVLQAAKSKESRESAKSIESANNDKNNSATGSSEEVTSAECAPRVEDTLMNSTATADTEILVSNKIVRSPIRSGQQVYASGGDLIVLAQVSAGAEILADGNIHVYAPLRGRALAGVKGDESALIFCQSLEAELVSIAGQYKLSEDLQGPSWKKPTQISLKDEKLSFSDLQPDGI